MRKSATGWKADEIRIDGVNLITNYRNTFAAKVADGGVDGLIKALADKNRQSSYAGLAFSYTPRPCMTIRPPLKRLRQRSMLRHRRLLNRRRIMRAKAPCQLVDPRLALSGRAPFSSCLNHFRVCHPTSCNIDSMP